MSKINTSACLKVHSFAHWLELQFDLEAMGYAVSTTFSENIIASNPRFISLRSFFTASTPLTHGNVNCLVNLGIIKSSFIRD